MKYIWAGYTDLLPFEYMLAQYISPSGITTPDMQPKDKQLDIISTDRTPARRNSSQPSRATSDVPNLAALSHPSYVAFPSHKLLECQVL
jgi:hypothetical protein